MSTYRRFKVKNEKLLAEAEKIIVEKNISRQELTVLLNTFGQSEKQTEINLPAWLVENKKTDIIAAIETNTPILIAGKQGPTGKTYLANLLKEQGALAFEEWECVKVTLNDFHGYGVL